MTFADFYNTFELKSDKGTIHDYINGWYSSEFTPIRHDNLNILEIGIQHGYSIKLLSEWFYNSTIYGIDNFEDPKIIKSNTLNLITNNNINFFEEDAYQKKCLDLFSDNSLDYIIDDGPHYLESNLYCIEYWYKKLKMGGTMIIEDIQNIESEVSYYQDICKKNNIPFEIVDLRSRKNRHDDVLLIFKKI